MTQVRRIPLLALLFVSAMEFILERALIDQLLITGRSRSCCGARTQVAGRRRRTVAAPRKNRHNEKAPTPVLSEHRKQSSVQTRFRSGTANEPTNSTKRVDQRTVTNRMNGLLRNQK
jgi:hypothetical protein